MSLYRVAVRKWVTTEFEVTVEAADKREALIAGEDPGMWLSADGVDADMSDGEVEELEALEAERIEPEDDASA